MEWKNGEPPPEMRIAEQPTESLAVEELPGTEELLHTLPKCGSQGCRGKRRKDPPQPKDMGRSYTESSSFLQDYSTEWGVSTAHAMQGRRRFKKFLPTSLPRTCEGVSMDTMFGSLQARTRLGNNMIQVSVSILI